MIGPVECAAVGEWAPEGGKASFHGVFPYGIFIGVEVLVHNHMWLLYLSMGGGCPRHLECLEDVPLHGQVAVPENLIGEDDGHLGACIDVTFLELIVTAREVGVECKALW